MNSVKEIRNKVRASAKTLYLLFKKDVLVLKSYIIAFYALQISLVLLFLLVFFLYERSINDKFLFYYKLTIYFISFVLALSFSSYMPINSITNEEKQRTFKVLKGLPFNNYSIFFSKLLFGYILSILLFVLPAIIILILKRYPGKGYPQDVPREIIQLFTYQGCFELILILMLVSTLSTCLYLNFKGNQIFIGTEIIMLIFVLGLLFVLNVRGRDDATLYRVFLVPFAKFLNMIFIFCPVLIILSAFVGYKIFANYRSYSKYQ